jgi:Domain of Unknown Function (DUF1080)
MRVCVVGIVLGTACLLSAPVGGGEPATEAGWVDLLAGKGLKGWKRVPIAPDTKLNAKDPWTLDEAGRVLACDGVGVKEMLLYDREFQDGTFHVEWRFRPAEGKPDYNSGVYVRTAADGTVWHQAQVAHLEKAPRMADLFGETLAGGKPEKFQVTGRGTELVRPPGEWNAYDVTCTGPKVTVAVNGTVATTWDGCQVRRGHVGLQAEYYVIEFRNVRFKPME